jgi:tungstate transport system ATP-binding protein
MQNVYELENISKIYGKTTALYDITLDIGEGPIGVVGYSGAGKTTLMKILAGLEMPSAGKMRFKDVEITDRNMQSLRRVVTMLFQEPVFFNRSVLENVMYGLRIRGVDEDEATKRASETLASLRLEGFENRRATKLSVGEQQRVSLARALVLDPEVLLLDEPTSNLDPANAGVILGAIEEFAEGGLVIVSMHNFLHVRRLARWVVYLEGGRVVEAGATSDVLDNPRDERVRRFVNGLF